MKPVLLALAVILACAVYERDRESAAGWHTQVEVDRVLNEELRAGSGWIPGEDEPGAAAVRPAPVEADIPRARTGSEEREQSIRLFGPGVSRRQQIRV